MSGSSFVDTNIMVYARDPTDPDKQTLAEDLLKRLSRDRSGRISTQVLNEYYVTVTHKLKPGMLPEEAWLDVKDFQVWRPVAVDMPLLHQAFRFQQRYGLSWWDSLIVGAAALSDCVRVYSEDLSHRQMYFGIEVVNPFV
ncbi:MAG: PIN domain-containing protein [Kiritimatiellia bacterium]